MAITFGEIQAWDGSVKRAKSHGLMIAVSKDDDCLELTRDRKIVATFPDVDAASWFLFGYDEASKRVGSR